MSATQAETQFPDGRDERAPDSPDRSAARNVLHLIAPGAVGGAESVVRLLAAEQQARGTRVAVAGIIDGEGPSPFLDALRDTSIETHVVRVGPRAYMTERRAVAAIAEALSPCLLHTHGYRADVVDARYLRRRGVPIVSTVHGFTGGDLKNQFYQWLQCRAYRHFDAVVAVSSPLGRQLAPLVGSGKLHVVPNGYRSSSLTLRRDAARAALGLPPETFVIGWVGRLSREKGADLLLEALAGPSEIPDAAHATFLGDGPRFEALRQHAARSCLGTRVSWQGRVADAERMFSAFDVFVLSSRTEGTPMVVLEAMAAGVPIVATRVGGVPDLLAPGTALLVPPESPTELAAAIRSVFLDRDAAAARARAARARLAAEYGVATWASRYETVYERACNTAAR